jgi:hypothetical protein
MDGEWFLSYKKLHLQHCPRKLNHTIINIDNRKMADKPKFTCAYISIEIIVINGDVTRNSLLTGCWKAL